ncbi:MAG: protein kinase [Deltaproteobacteria bacterium]|nr:protein kinase [Deltaproteobacteria bacterium]
MAEVFLAKAYGAHGFEKTLAIKRILPELARDPEFEERFIAEAKVAVRLSHTNIIQVLDFGRFAGSLFIAMEFIDGLDLAALLRRNKENDRLVPLPAAFHIAIEILRGLDFAHHHGVVHRDVSPSNILLSRAGEVKIGDFGIAVAARPMAGPVGVARKVMGKWRYMSPEQARGDQLDTKSDLFSAASVIFELFTGEKLFPGEEAEDIIRNINEMPLPRPSTMRPGLPARLDDILHHALARKPGDRPARAALMQRQLTELSYESSIVATALDVADAVGAVIDLRAPAGRHSLDDIIRRQIAGALGGIPVGDRATAVSDVSRRTAQNTNPDASDLIQKLDETGKATLLPSIDSDGLTNLIDETTIAAVPKAIGRTTGPVTPISDGASGRTRRITESDEQSAYPRETPRETSGRLAVSQEVERVTRFERPTIDAAEPGSVPTVTSTSGPASRWPLALAAAAIAGLAGGGVWLATRESREVPITVPPPAPAVDAAAPAHTGMLVLDSIPPGATATVDGKEVGVTPTRAEVAAGRPLEVKLTKAGYQPVVDRQQVNPGETLVYRPTLVIARARLRVDSDPRGATVTLRGRDLGVTPLDVPELEPLGKVELVLTLTGHERAVAPVELRPGELASARIALRATPKFGTIQIQVTGDVGWGEIYLNGKAIGRAPAKALRLPIGKHRLRLVNPPTHKETSLDVEVGEGDVRVFVARF